MNRLTRDAILQRALNFADSPSLDAKDRPEGTILSGALSVSFLQEALDAFHAEFPWQGVIASASVTIPPSGTIELPADFILDVRDGLVMPGHRLARISLQRLITAQARQTHTTHSNPLPAVYCWVASSIKVHPKPVVTQSAILWYYALPAELGANDKPVFPTDHILVEYVHLRCKEWTRVLPPGTARQYADREIARLRAAGLAGEPESDRIAFDPLTFRGAAGPSDTDWMGSTTLPSEE